MGILRNVSALSYTRIEEWDPEEKKHRDAQFMIYKNLQQVGKTIGYKKNPVPKPTGLIRLRISKLRVKVGRRFLRLRKNVVIGLSKAKANFCRQVSGKLKVWGRLFTGSAASSPSAAVVGRLPQPPLS